MIHITLGDITKISVDSIVNAANSTLLGGGGVDGAIHRAAGPELLAECRTLHGCKTGSAKATKAYNIPVKQIIHTVGPIWKGGTHGEAELLKSCYMESLRLAEKAGSKSIAFPAISCGVYSYPLNQACDISVDSVVEYLQSCSSDMEVYFVAFDEFTRKEWQRAYDELSHRGA